MTTLTKEEEEEFTRELAALEAAEAEGVKAMTEEEVNAQLLAMEKELDTDDEEIVLDAAEEALIADAMAEAAAEEEEGVEPRGFVHRYTGVSMKRTLPGAHALGRRWGLWGGYSRRRRRGSYKRKRKTRRQRKRTKRRRTKRRRTKRRRTKHRSRRRHR